MSNNLTDGGKDLSGVLKLAKAAKQSKLKVLKLGANGIPEKAAKAVREAAGPGVDLQF